MDMVNRPLLCAVMASLLVAVTGCNGEKANGYKKAAKNKTVKAQAVSAKSIPLGDNKQTTTGPRRGYIYSCRLMSGGGGAFRDGPWINGKTWDLTEKLTVDGSVSWASASVSFQNSGDKLNVTSNALPKGSTTGTFPISTSDDAYQYDRNPNSIAAQSLSYSLPANPKMASKASCASGEVGIAINGVPIFNGMDAGGRDAGAHEVQDSCAGHPERTGTYHYHTVSSCLTGKESSRKHSGVVGYAFDGFAIFGRRGSSGKKLTNADLGSCHGHTHKVTVNGKSKTRYHYHATLEFPYTIGCFRGTPVKTTPVG